MLLGGSDVWNTDSCTYYACVQSKSGNSFCETTLTNKDPGSYCDFDINNNNHRRGRCDASATCQPIVCYGHRHCNRGDDVSQQCSYYACNTADHTCGASLTNRPRGYPCNDGDSFCDGQGNCQAKQICEFESECNPGK